MFAVAIWDAPRQRLVLARDRVGKKPLYYSQQNGELLFGSETKAILAALDRRAAGQRRRRCSSFFTFGYVAGQHAVFEGMQRLTPGTALIVDVARRRRSTSNAFWTWPAAPHRDAMPEDEAIERLRAELDEAVRIRLRSDVPLGAFLSGGMDSAAVLALMAQHSSRPVKTFTIGFGDPAYDELDDARATAAHFGADHHEQIVTPDCVARRRNARGALRRAVRRRVGDSDVLRRRAGAPARHGVPDRRRRRRAVRRLHAVRRRARARRLRAASTRCAALSAPARAACRCTRAARGG